MVLLVHDFAHDAARRGRRTRVVVMGGRRTTVFLSEKLSARLAAAALAASCTEAELVTAGIRRMLGSPAGDAEP